MPSSENANGKSNHIDIASSINNDTTFANGSKTSAECSGAPTRDEQPAKSGSTISTADIIGEYGIYQLSLTILTFIRYMCTALMANAGPLLAPSVDFWCTKAGNANFSPTNATLNKCELSLNEGSHDCQQFLFSNSSGMTLTNEFELVCKRDWLRSAVQSIITVGIVLASVIWGSISDRYGRAFTIKICFFVTLLSSIASRLTDRFIVFAVSRSISSFGDLGLAVSLTTIIVETLGNKYRGATGLVVYTGWSFGVMAMPWLVDYYKNYQHSMIFLIMVHLFTLPWLLTVGESPRWLLVNGYIEKAGAEFRRISKWNLRGDKDSLALVDRNFDKMKGRFVLISEKHKLRRELEEANMNTCQLICRSLFGGLSKVGEIFQTRELSITALTLIWTTFTSEFLYMLFTIINSDIGDNIKLNYAIGGLMETFATIISVIMISTITRRLSLTSTLASISCLSFTLALTHNIPSVSVWVLNLTKLAVSTLSSLVYVTTTEVYPTNLRQTGFGLSGTVGSLGAVIAPFVRTELTDLIGMTRVLFIVMFVPLSAATIIPFFLRETKGIELSDDVEELENDHGIELKIPSRSNSLKQT